MQRIFFGILTLCLSAAPEFASAHVRYFANEPKGADFDYFLSPLINQFNILLIMLTVIATLAIGFAFSRSQRIQDFWNRVTDKAAGYQKLLPWMLRLPLGIGLIGFGTNDVLLTPVLSATGGLGLLEILLGFMILVGFLVTPSAICVAILFLFGVIQEPFLIGSLDILAITLSLTILDSRRPGVDDLLCIPGFSISQLKSWVPLILRLGLGIGMLYLGVYEKILNPRMAAAVVAETGLTSVIPVSEAMWVFSAGIIESLIGFVLIIGWRVRLFSIIAFLVLSASFFYFEEDVYSHVTLFGSLAAIFVTQSSAKNTADQNTDN